MSRPGPLWAVWHQEVEQPWTHRSGGHNVRNPRILVFVNVSLITRLLYWVQIALVVDACRSATDTDCCVFISSVVVYLDLFTAIVYLAPSYISCCHK